ISRVFVVLQLKHQIIKMLVESPQNEAGLDYSEIQKYYSGSTLLITGGTGFLGKVLVEKLLRSCPGIAKIYLLVRQKKGVTANKRFTEQFSGPKTIFSSRRRDYNLDLPIKDVQTKGKQRLDQSR
ncbi:unnamed protein product, partial [Timema podura]|nr:unnamed protein product [Timema podura]